MMMMMQEPTVLTLMGLKQQVLTPLKPLPPPHYIFHMKDQRESCLTFSPGFVFNISAAAGDEEHVLFKSL